MSNVGRIAAQAANTLTTPLNVEEVFSTYVYTGNGSTQTITNGIDLAGEGGLVWVKSRSNAYSHFLLDTERGTQKVIQSNATTAQISTSNTISAFNSDGWTMGDRAEMNQSSSQTYASWTFRKAPKFFDVVTYTGNDTAGTTISHNLGVQPAVIIVKSTSAAGNWVVYHRSNGAGKYMLLNSTAAAVSDTTIWNNTEPTATEFTLGAAGGTNYGGRNYVAYLFAHNNGDGDFGPTGDQDVIRCGSYTGNDLDDGPEINLGFEPQWLLVKNASTARNWIIVDNMRGIVSSSTANDALLYPNLSNAEDGATSIALTPTGFKCVAGGDNFNGNGHTMIYIAIRRGPMAVPESATDVFHVEKKTNPNSFVTSNFVTDFAFHKKTGASDNWYTFNRLAGDTKYLQINLTNAEASVSSPYLTTFDHMDGVDFNIYASQTNDTAFYMWKRAPSFFDVVAYTGTGSARTVSHNLGVAPEMIWVKNRTNNTRFWAVYSASLGTGYAMELNGSTAPFSGTSSWNGTAPTSSVFTVNTHSTVNESGANFITYLFASLDGVSKVGSYTGNGSTQTINCGFSSGARFILIKRTDSTGDWYIWDAESGIVSANDPHLSLNTTAAQVTTDDSVDPVSSGFAVNQVAATNINVSSASYIYYAIA